MSRGERDFLAGFEKAAVLTRQMLETPPAYTSREEYALNVAHLHADSEDLRSRGLAVGCMAALGRD